MAKTGSIFKSSGRGAGALEPLGFVAGCRRGVKGQELSLRYRSGNRSGEERRRGGGRR